MEQYINYITSNYIEIVSLSVIALPIFLFFVFIRGIIWVIFNREPFGFISDFKENIKTIRFKHILLFLFIYLFIIFGVYIPIKINLKFYKIIFAFFFMIFMIVSSIYEYKNLVKKKIKRKLTFDDKM